MNFDKQLIMSQKRRQSVDAVFVHPAHKENRHVVERLVARLRFSHNLAQFYELQLSLFKAIHATETKQQEQEDCLKRIGALRKEVVARRKKSGVLDGGRMWELEQQESKCKVLIEVFKQVRRELRSVGDGLLWKAVGFNRGYIIGVSSAPGEGNRHLSDPDGLEAELEHVKYYFESGRGLAVLHDLTNCGRVGDLTFVAPGALPTALEVKSSQPKNSRRVARQRERLKELSQFVQDRPMTSKSGTRRHLGTIDAPLSAHSGDLLWNG